MPDIVEFLPGGKHVSSSVGSFVNYLGNPPKPGDVWEVFPNAVIVDGDDNWHSGVHRRPQRLIEDFGIRPLAYFHTGISGITRSGVVLSPEDYETFSLRYLKEHGRPVEAVLRVYRNA